VNLSRFSRFPRFPTVPGTVTGSRFPRFPPYRGTGDRNRETGGAGRLTVPAFGNRETAGGATLKLKSQRHVRQTLNLLVEGGALQDARERPSRTTPLLVTPAGETPCRILLPTIEDLAQHGFLPPGASSKRSQVFRVHRDSSDILVKRSDILASALSNNDLTSLGSASGGGNSLSAPRTPALDPSVYDHGGQLYRAGDVLPDGRIVESVDYGIPTLKHKPNTADGGVHS